MPFFRLRLLGLCLAGGKMKVGVEKVQRPGGNGRTVQIPGELQLVQHPAIPGQHGRIRLAESPA